MYVITGMLMLTSCGQVSDKESEANGTVGKNIEVEANDIISEAPVNEPTNTIEDTTNNPDNEVSVTPTEDSKIDDIPNQLQIIVDNKSLWFGDVDGERYGYAITDLNHNGRIEIISSSTQGTGIYSYSKYWEVNESFDGLVQYSSTVEEYDSEADIIKESVPVYYDSDQNRYYYIFDDLIKNGAAEYCENKRGLYFEQEQVFEVFLAYKTTIYVNSSPTITYEDADEHMISEEEYNNIADQVFAGMEKKQANMKWLLNETSDINGLSDEELLRMLEESYLAFSVK